MRQHAQRQRANPRPHLEHAARFVKVCQIENLGNHVVVHEKILSEPMLGRQAKALEHMPRGRWVSER